MLPRKRLLGQFLALLLLAGPSQEHGNGAPAAACIDQLPRHSSPPIQPQITPPPYLIAPAASQVRQGGILSVTIGSPAGAPVPIGGFILQARSVQDPDQIVGKFVSVPDPSKTHISNCRGQNDTVTHSSPEEKPALTFQWQAPDDFLGSVEFRSTIAQDYSTFWRGIESPLVEVVKKDAVIATPQTPPTVIPTPTPAPPVIMESRPKQENFQQDLIYQGCDDTKLCFGVPQNCIPSGNCIAIAAVFVAGDQYTFELQATGNPKYVAAGLSMDKNMGDDSAMECVRMDNGQVKLFTSWTYPKEEPYVNRAESPQDIVQLQGSSVIDGKLYCKFKRDAVSEVKGRSFDLINNKYHLMVLAGDSMKDANRVGFHNKAFEATGSPLALSTVGTAKATSKVLLKLHGSFMVAAWIGAASLGILLARYFRQTWVGKQVGGKDIWFAYHRILMVLVWLLTVSGFVLILIDAGGWNTGPHSITGVITVALCFIQPIGAYFRPHPGTKKRPYFNWLHWLVGNAAHILAIATIFLAVEIPKAELPQWGTFIMVAFVIFHVIMHVVLSLTVCVSDGRISNGRVNAFPMKDMLGQPRQTTQVDRSIDAPFSSFRKLLLAIYALLIVLFAVAMICLVALAPIATTYNNIMGA